MIVTKIAATVFVVALVTTFFSAQFASPFPQIIDKPKVVFGFSLLVMVIAFLTVFISSIWGL